MRRRGIRPMKAMNRPKKCIIDKELMIFRKKIFGMKCALNDQNTTVEKKSEIKKEIFQIVDDCHKHLGYDLNYSFGNDVSATFKKFYLPRLNIVKSMLPEYFAS